VEEVEKETTNVEVGKAIEEDKRKHDEDAPNGDTYPMDIDILETSTRIPIIGGNLPINKMGLGLHTPYNLNKVEDLKKFQFDKDIRRIVQQQNIKLPVTRGNPLFVVT
jgi:hypothetical protein